MPQLLFSPGQIPNDMLISDTHPRDLAFYPWLCHNSFPSFLCSDLFRSWWWSLPLCWISQPPSAHQLHHSTRAFRTSLCTLLALTPFQFITLYWPSSHGSSTLTLSLEWDYLLTNSSSLSSTGLRRNYSHKIFICF